MDLYFFRHAQFERLYNCSYTTPNEWTKYGIVHFGFSECFLLAGAICIILYLLILRAMCRAELIKHSCFKIMLFLGLCDVSSILALCTTIGYMGINGTVPCSNIDFTYILGCLEAASWFSQCSTCVLLVFNRCVDYFKPSWLTTMFAGRRTIIWLLVSSVGMSYSFNLYDGISHPDTTISNSQNVGVFFLMDNVTFVATTSLLYGFFLMLFIWQKMTGLPRKVSKMRKQRTEWRTIF
ncbi:hypothetical protein QR680_015735 [Steinernema hermaphroditum]|uniref:Uncharacterized protein n=1 Tax=Steinernema hermaphroditum TaxID=289476 RepID=A0AA39LLE5_9BILA|nr:hypothetical protein QR680_015735 [Steinernema hermaphroditum]